MVCFGYQRKRSGRWLTLVQMQQMLVAFTFTKVIKKRRGVCFTNTESDRYSCNGIVQICVVKEMYSKMRLFDV